MLKDELTSNVAGIILHHVKETKGRLTEISDLCGINRKEFNVRGFASLKLHRLLRVIYALYLELPYAEFVKMTDEIRETIIEYGEDYDYTLLDE